MVLDGDLDRPIETAAEAVMSDVQDEVAEQLRVPWPGDRTMPLPEAEIRKAELHLWFGDRGAPTLVLPPIPLPQASGSVG